MQKKLLTIDEKIFKDVKRRYKGGLFSLVSDSLFIRSLLEDVNTKLNRG